MGHEAGIQRGFIEYVALVLGPLKQEIDRVIDACDFPDKVLPVPQVDRLSERSVVHFLLSCFNGLRRSDHRHPAIDNNLRSWRSLFKGRAITIAERNAREAYDRTSPWRPMSKAKPDGTVCEPLFCDLVGSYDADPRRYFLDHGGNWCRIDPPEKVFKRPSTGARSMRSWRRSGEFSQSRQGGHGGSQTRRSH
jgi:hypothetical protein